MADVSTVMGLPYPEGADDADVSADVLALVTRLDATPGVESLTSAQIAALPAPQRPAGRVVHNSTTGRLQLSTGASFVDVADVSKLPLAGGTMTGPIAMGGSKITGLAAATANGDAVRFEQVPVGGRSSGTTDGDGYFNILHGMGVTPSWAVVTIESSGSPRGDFAIVNGRSSTIIEIRVYRGGSPLGSGAVSANWVAR